MARFYLHCVARSKLSSELQMIILHPDGTAQECHRDYHLGLQETDTCLRYLALTQLTSQFLGLQGAVAPSDLPVISNHAFCLLVKNLRSRIPSQAMVGVLCLFPNCTSYCR